MADICPVCNKVLSLLVGEPQPGIYTHPSCEATFLQNPEKYIRKAEVPSNSEPSDKDFITTLLICVFLGGLGAHRFFVDKSDTGILMLVTLGGLGIWWIIDILLIVTGSFEDNEGRVIAYQAAGTANREPVKDIPAEIRKFAELKKDGLISEEEFDKKKEELL